MRAFSYTVYPSFSFPPNTYIAPGECILVIENSSPTTSAINPTPPGTQIFNTNFSYGWIGTSTGAIVLADAYGVGQDLLRFGTAPGLTPPGGASLFFGSPWDRSINDPTLENVIFRKLNADTDHSADWHEKPNDNETPGLPNPGQSNGASPTAALILADNSGQIVIDPNTGVLSCTTTVASLKLIDGRYFDDTSFDSMIGGTVTLSGQFIGTNLVDFALALWVPVTITLSSTGGDVLTFTGVVSAEPNLEYELVGPLATEPRELRPMTTRSLTTNNLVGANSSALSSTTSIAATDQLWFMVRFDPSGPRLVRIELGRNASSLPPTLESKIAADTAGVVEVGVIRTTQSEIYNVFIVNPVLSLGQGPIFGIDWGPFQWSQVYMPLSTAPFHVSPQVNGSYHFRSAPGAVPLGIWLDFLTIEVVNGIPLASPPTRAFFQ